MDSPPLDDNDNIEVLTPLLGQLHSKWVTLNDKCKTLQSSLTEATSKSEELEIKLNQALERTTKVEEENKRLKMTVKKLQNKFITGSVHKLFSALKQNISAYEETVLPSILKLTKAVTDTEEDLEISNSEEDENLENHKSPAAGSSNPNETCANHVVSQSTQTGLSKAIISPIRKISLQDLLQRYALKKPILGTSCNSKISSSSVTTTSSTITENDSEAPEISKTQSPEDQGISSTTSLNVPTSNKTPAVCSPKVEAESSQNSAQPPFIDISDIESCIVEEEEQITKSDASSPVKPDFVASMNETFLFPVAEPDPLVQSKQTPYNFSYIDSQGERKKQKVLLMSLIKPSNIEDIPCTSTAANTSKSETNQSERFKRPCPSSSNLNESSPKHSSPKKLKITSTKNRKCLICEYEDIDGLNDKTFESVEDHDQHILENHPDPAPCYVRCMFDDGKCTRHFHPKQKFHRHVKKSHSNEDLDSIFKTSQRKPLKCTTCDKLYLFESDLKEHNAKAHNHRVSLERKPLNAFNKKSKFTAECEVCKKENRPSVTYRLYDELDTHIAKCHSDPFPDYLRCPYCTRHFKLVPWLTQHIVNKHPNSYSDSPLEKFLPNQRLDQAPEESELEFLNDVDIMETKNPVKPTSTTEACPLRILSPSSINKSLSNAIKSVSSNIMA